MEHHPLHALVAYQQVGSLAQDKVVYAIGNRIMQQFNQLRDGIRLAEDIRRAADAEAGMLAEGFAEADGAGFHKLGEAGTDLVYQVWLLVQEIPKKRLTSLRSSTSLLISRDLAGSTCLKYWP